MKRSSRSFVLAGAIALALAGVGSAFAASGGGGGSTPACPKGHVYKQGQGCVKVGSDLLDDKQLFEQGRALAKAGHYENALAVLAAVKDQNDPMVLTMIGYSKRKMGQIDEGMLFYHKALSIDPDNVNTREYLGEGYVTIGRKDLALVELARIEKICGADCEQYEDLAAAIAGGSGW